jgi:hypothetical protein
LQPGSLASSSVISSFTTLEAHENSYLLRQQQGRNPRRVPEVVVHRFEEKLVVILVEYMLEVLECDCVDWFVDFDQVRRVLVFQVIDYLRLFHDWRLGAGTMFY